MPDPSPWNDIAVPGSDFNVRRVESGAAVPCYWGRSADGACLFIIELEGDHSAQFRKDNTTVRGISVDLRAGAPGLQRLVLALEQQVDRDLFEGLCRTLASALTHASDASSSLAVALAHLRRWKAFLSGRGGRHLSPEEVRGLFAELTFLLELVQRTGSAVDAVAAWLGPEMSHQDFIFGNTAVEIKSLSGAERSAVRISSEDQLESLNDALFLRVYRLSQVGEAPGAESLNGLVTGVQRALSCSSAIEAFERKLAGQGYAPLPEYDEPKFLVSEVRTFAVDDAFPRLVRSALPGGVTKVRYDIQLEAITQFACDGADVFGGR